GKSVFYHDHSGDLLVRGTAEDLDRIEQALARVASGRVVDPKDWPTETNHFSANPASANYTQNGKEFFELGKWDLAEHSLRLALPLDPMNTAAQYYLSLVQQSRNRTASAEPSLPATRSTPTDSNSTNLLIRMFKVDPNTFCESLCSAGVLSSSNLISNSRSNSVNEIA